MNKLFRRDCFALSMIAAALLLLASAPAGAFAAGEESSGGAGSGDAAVEPSGDSAQPAAPPSTEWSPQDSGEGASSGGAAPLEQGSSVGSGVTTGKAGSDVEAPSGTPDSSGSYEPEPSDPATFEEPASAPRAESGIQLGQPSVTATATAVRAGGAVDEAEVGSAIQLGRSAPPQGGGNSTAPPAAASFTGSDDPAYTSSSALPVLVIALLGLVGFAVARLRRRRQRRRLEAFWREQDAVWETTLRQAELGQVAGDSEPSVQPLRQINVG